MGINLKKSLELSCLFSSTSWQIWWKWKSVCCLFTFRSFQKLWRGSFQSNLKKIKIWPLHSKGRIKWINGRMCAQQCFWVYFRLYIWALKWSFKNFSLLFKYLNINFSNRRNFFIINFGTNSLKVGRCFSDVSRFPYPCCNSLWKLSTKLIVDSIIIILDIPRSNWASYKIFFRHLIWFTFILV